MAPLLGRRSCRSGCHKNMAAAAADGVGCFVLAAGLTTGMCLGVMCPPWSDGRGRSGGGHLIESCFTARARRGPAGDRRLHHRCLLGLPRQDRQGRQQTLTCLRTPTLTQQAPGRHRRSALTSSRKQEVSGFGVRAPTGGSCLRKLSATAVMALPHGNEWPSIVSAERYRPSFPPSVSCGQSVR